MSPCPPDSQATRRPRSRPWRAGSNDRRRRSPAPTRSSRTSESAQSTPAAEAGTERLSSSLIGIVSTNAATSAATSGAAIENHTSGVGVTFGRHHQATSEPARPPQRNSASVPAKDFSRFHGIAPQPEAPAGDRRHPVADGQDRPGGRGDIEAIREDQHEQQHRDRGRGRCPNRRRADVHPGGRCVRRLAGGRTG